MAKCIDQHGYIAHAIVIEDANAFHFGTRGKITDNACNEHAMIFHREASRFSIDVVSGDRRIGQGVIQRIR